MKARKFRLVAAAAAVMLFVGACGGGGESSDEDSGDKTLTVITHLGPITMDPHRLAQWQNSQFLMPVYEALTEVDAKGQVQPRLATDWEYSEDGLTFSMNLRDDVTFSDGEKFDADVVKMNLDRLLEMEDSPLRGFIGNIESVEVESPTRVSIKTKAPDAQLPSMMGDRQGMMISPALLESGEEIADQAIGTGPYKLVSVRPNEGTVYERNDDYWGEAAQAAKLEFQTVADNTARLNAVQTGAADIAYITATNIDAAQNADLGISQAAGLFYIHVYTNLASPPLDDVNVRRAISLALDRQALCDAAYQGHCEISSSGFPPSNPFASPNVGPDFFPHDPDQAKQILADAGYGEGEVEFELIIPAGVDPYPALSELMQQQLAEAGITLKIRPEDLNQLTEIYAVQKDGQAMLGGGGQVDDPGQYLQQFFAPTALYNPAGISPGGLEDVITQVRTTVDPDARIEVIHEAVEIIADQAFNIPLVQPRLTYVYDEDTVEGYEASEVGLIFLVNNIKMK